MWEFIGGVNCHILPCRTCTYAGVHCKRADKPTKCPLSHYIFVCVYLLLKLCVFLFVKIKKVGGWERLKEQEMVLDYIFIIL